MYYLWLYYANTYDAKQLGNPIGVALFFFFSMKNKTQNTKYKGKLKAVGLYINDVCMVSNRKQKHDKHTNSI